jgi:hypothetical protein
MKYRLGKCKYVKNDKNGLHRITDYIFRWRFLYMFEKYEYKGIKFVNAFNELTGSHYEESLLKIKGIQSTVHDFPSFCDSLKSKGISETSIASYFSRKTGTLFENVLNDMRKIDIGKINF